MLRTAVIAFLLSVSIALCADSVATPETLHDGAPDGTGRVWAFQATTKDALLVHDGDAWHYLPFSPGESIGAKPIAVTPLRDGSVLCVWRSAEEKRMLISRHLGKESKLWAKFEGKFGGGNKGSIRVTEDSVGNVWLTESGPSVYRFDSDGSGGLAYSIPENALFPPRNRPLSPVSITEDSRGRLWFWAKSWWVAGAMILYSEGKFELIQGILPEEGSKQRPFLSVAAKDATTFWVAAINEGLFEFDLNTLEVRRSGEAGSELNMGSSSAIFEEKGAWYFAVNNPERRLWQLKEGKWTKIDGPLGNWRGGHVDRKCLVVKATQGILFDEIGALLRFGNMEKPPEMFDWRSGFNLREVARLYALADGRIFALGSEGKFYLGHLKNPVSATDTRRIRVMNHAFLWRPDPAGKMWATLERNSKFLSHWNGREWKEFAIPAGIQVAQCSDLAFDSKGCVWLLPDFTELSVGVLDPKTSSWKIYPKIESAIDAGFITFPGDEPRAYVPTWSSDRKRAAFRSKKAYGIGYFDGTTWKRLAAKEIGPDGKGGVGVPFFDQKDRLCVHVREETWTYTNPGWEKVSWEAGPLDDIQGVKPKKEKPPGPALKAGESAVLDNLGAWWVLRNDTLSKFWENQTVEVFEADEPNPMRDGRKLQSVFVDPSGTAFLKTSFGEVQISPRSSACDTSVKLERVSPYTVVLRSGASGSEAKYFRWRLDGGEWKSSKDSNILVENLTPGQHAAEVAAVSRDLVPDATPTQIQFTMTYSADDRTRELIAQLGDAEYAKREEAVRALVKSGKDALPTLRKAAATAADRWWFDAAIQEIERTQKKH